MFSMDFALADYATESMLPVESEHLLPNLPPRSADAPRALWFEE
jgi:hypothetical protein